MDHSDPTGEDDAQNFFADMVKQLVRNPPPPSPPPNSTPVPEIVVTAKKQVEVAANDPTCNVCHWGGPSVAPSNEPAPTWWPHSPAVQDPTAHFAKPDKGDKEKKRNADKAKRFLRGGRNAFSNWFHRDFKSGGGVTSGGGRSNPDGDDEELAEAWAEWSSMSAEEQDRYNY